MMEKNDHQGVCTIVNEPSVILNNSLAMILLHRSFQNEWSTRHKKTLEKTLLQSKWY
uniref:Uncharacterized protein n=1 Tax=Romanomermis culicivorax TaxID=13658 RepID=A0A915HRT9_ROMCU